MLFKKFRHVDQRVRYSLILSALPPPPGRVLEVGVGSGILLHVVAELNYEAFGCDIDLSAFPADSFLADSVRQADGAVLPYPDSYFDITFSCDVLEHVPPHDRDSFLEEMVRVTKPGGKILLTAFFHNTLSFLLYGAGHLLRQKKLPSWYLEHLDIPSPEEEVVLRKLNSLLEQVTIYRYQRSLNLFFMWLELISKRNYRFSQVVHYASAIVPFFDFFGKTTSAFFTGTKSLEPQEGYTE